MDLKQFVEDINEKLNSIERRLNSLGGGGGQTNTASNIGAGGIGLYQQKVGVDLQFRNINAASARISVALDAGNNEVDLDVVEAQINHNNLSGLQGGQADQYYHLNAAEHPYVSGVNAQSLLKTASPYFVQLGLLDTGSDHELYLKCNENLAADRILNLVVGNAERTITLSGNPTLADWFDQSVKQAASPIFVTAKLSALTNGYLPYHVSDAVGLANSGIFWDSGNSRVGIGTSVPTKKLDVRGRVTISSGSTPDNLYHGDLIITKPKVSGQYINLVRDRSFSWSIGTVYNSVKFGIGQGKTTDSLFSPTFVIDAALNVGIGETSPVTKLHIKGVGGLTVQGSGSASQIVMKDSDGNIDGYLYATGGQISLSNSTGNPSITLGADRHMDIWDWDDAVMREVDFGADDSGGAGYKVLRIPN